MNLKTYKLYIFLALCGTIPTSFAGDISSSLIKSIYSRGNADAVLELPSIMTSVFTNPIFSAMEKGAARTSFMTGLMKQMTAAAQAPFLSALQMMGVQDVQPFWVSNKISMKGISLPVVNAIRAIPGTFTIREPIKAKLIPPKPGNSSVQASGVQWGVVKIGADAVWASTTNGKGVIVAGIDTGVMGNHEALRDNYAGFFHDAISGQDDQPYDDNGHGTHTMGTICGTKNGIGVAPGAKWVACKGLDSSGSGNDATLSECAQWVLSLDQLPTVVSNSWGGGGGQTFYNDEISAFQAAGIVPVFAIGNEGPQCGTAGSPGDQANVISVGATTSQDQMADFSSRGPSTKRVMKPEVSAPGQSIYSAWTNGRYNTISGTSMATPHVAGAVALMRAANPNIAFKDILKALEDTAERPKPTNSDLSCGRVSSSNPYPNNAWGYGRINVKKAIGGGGGGGGC